MLLNRNVQIGAGGVEFLLHRLFVPRSGNRWSLRALGSPRSKFMPSYLSSSSVECNPQETAGEAFNVKRRIDRPRQLLCHDEVNSTGLLTKSR